MIKAKKEEIVYHGPIVGNYVIEGTPRPLQRARHGNGKTYDPQKQIKYSVGLELKSQHIHSELFDGPLKLDIIFFMPVPQRKVAVKLIRFPHFVKPDLSNLIKFIEDVATGIIYRDDALISTIVARKIYSCVSRTEFTITRLENNGETEGNCP